MPKASSSFQNRTQRKETFLLIILRLFLVTASGDSAGVNKTVQDLQLRVITMVVTTGTKGATDDHLKHTVNLRRAMKLADVTTWTNGASDDHLKHTVNLRQAMKLADALNTTSPAVTRDSPDFSNNGASLWGGGSMARKQDAEMRPRTSLISLDGVLKDTQPCTTTEWKVDNKVFVKPYPEKQKNGEVHYTGPKTTIITCVTQADDEYAQWQWLLQCPKHRRRIHWPYPQLFGAHAPRAFPVENGSCELFSYKTSLIFRLNATTKNCIISCVLGFMNGSRFEKIQEMNTLFKIVPYTPTLYISEDLRCLNYMEYIGMLGTFTGVAICLPYLFWYHRVKKGIHERMKLQTLHRDTSDQPIEIHMADTIC